MSISECEEREKGAESLLKEIIPNNYPNLGKKLEYRTWNMQVHEAKRTPNYFHAKRPSLRYIKTVKSKLQRKSCKGSQG